MFPKLSLRYAVRCTSWCALHMISDDMISYRCLLSVAKHPNTLPLDLYVQRCNRLQFRILADCGTPRRGGCHSCHHQKTCQTEYMYHLQSIYRAVQQYLVNIPGMISYIHTITRFRGERNERSRRDGSAFLLYLVPLIDRAFSFSFFFSLFFFSFGLRGVWCLTRHHVSHTWYVYEVHIYDT